MATVDLDKLKRLLADAGEYPNGNSYNPYLNDLIVAAPALIRRVERLTAALITIAENEIQGSVIERWAREALKKEPDSVG